jgi:hypothetical protein
MTFQAAGLDATEIDALQTDRYLDALLSAAERRADDVPADTAIDPTLRLAARRLRDELVRTHPSFRFEERLARRLADAALRMRLATAAGGEAEATVIPFPAPLLADPALAAELANPELAALFAAPHMTHSVGGAARDAAGGGATETGIGAPFAGGAAVAGGTAGTAFTAAAASTQVPADAAAWPFGPFATRPLLVGSALTSAALSLAGAAFVAWRLTRGAPSDPMARAVRAARAAHGTATTAARAGIVAASDGDAQLRPRRLA